MIQSPEAASSFLESGSMLCFSSSSRHSRSVIVAETTGIISSSSRLRWGSRQS